MKRLVIGFITFLFSIILPVAAFSITGFSEKLLVGKIHSDVEHFISEPRVSSGLKNDIYIVWLDENKDGTGSILLTRSLNGGLSFEEKRELDVNTDKDVIISPPEIGVDSKGAIYIVYSKLDYKNNQNVFSLILRKSNDSGDIFSTQTVYTREGDYTIGNTLGSDLKITDNGIYYAWSGLHEIYLSRILDGGNNVEIIEIDGGQNSIYSGYPIKKRIWPSLDIDTKNDIYVVWFEALLEEDTVTPLFDVYTAKLENGQQLFTESKMIAKCDTFGGFVLQPSIVVTSTNTVFVFWNDSPHNSENEASMYNRFSNNGGDTFSERIEITVGENRVLHDGEVAIDQNDVIHLIYYMNHDNMLYYTKSSDLCNSFEKGTEIGRTLFFTDMNFSDIEEEVYVVWHAENEEGKGVYFSRYGDQTDEKPTADASGSGGGSGGGCFIHRMRH